MCPKPVSTELILLRQNNWKRQIHAFKSAQLKSEVETFKIMFLICRICVLFLQYLRDVQPVLNCILLFLVENFVAFMWIIRWQVTNTSHYTVLCSFRSIFIHVISPDPSTCSTELAGKVLSLFCRWGKWNS